jgi:hypothetical protein
MKQKEFCSGLQSMTVITNSVNNYVLQTCLNLILFKREQWGELFVTVQRR